jgi:hypothetical protein
MTPNLTVEQTAFGRRSFLRQAACMHYPPVYSDIL